MSKPDPLDLAECNLVLCPIRRNVLSGLASQPQRNFFLDIETRFCTDVL
jgi:hypothetical protein